MTEVALVLDERLERLERDLIELGLAVARFNSVDEILEDSAASRRPDIIMIGPDPKILPITADLLRRSERTGRAYLMALVKRDGIETIKQSAQVDDALLVDYEYDNLRLRMALSASHLARARRPKIMIGLMSIDTDSYEVKIGDATISLTHREYELLKFLAVRRGRVFTRETLVHKIWKYEYLGGSRTVDVHVRRLRSKLGPRYGGMIETIRHVGYRFSRTPPD